MLPKIKKSLLRLGTGESMAWYHASPKDNQVLRLRRIPFDPNKDFEDKAVNEIQADFPDWKQFFLRDAGRMVSLPVESFPVAEPTAWLLVAERMERRISAKPTLVIPITALRRFYGWLRERPVNVVKEFLHSSLADHFVREPKRLADLFLTSCSEFASYDNREESFVEGRLGDRFRAGKRSGTDPLVRDLQDQGRFNCQCAGASLDFDFVDREVGPRRSSKRTGPWVFGDGRPASSSGAGGMDLLLVAHDYSQPVPVIGEVKVAGDETPFFALVQVLTYASELCTENQFTRLRRHYPAFAGLGDETRADVCLILSDLMAKHEAILARTMEVAAGLYRSDPRFGKAIRRIVILKAVLDEGHVKLTCLGAFGQVG